MSADTIPPPSPEAKALRAIGAELDVLGEAVTSLDTSVGALAEMSAEDHKVVVSKLDTIIALLTDPSDGLVARVGVLEAWRGEHVREAHGNGLQ